MVQKGVGYEYFKFCNLASNRKEDFGLDYHPDRHGKLYSSYCLI